MMTLFRPILGRRQFLISAFAASTLGPVYKKFMGAFVPGSENGIALASELPHSIATSSESSDSASKKGKRNKYGHLLSPLKIRNVILKNRLIYTVSIPQYLQGPETFPTEEIRSYYANVAKNVAIVTIRMSTGRKPRRELQKDHAHMASWDGDNPAVINYIDQMVEGIHSMGALVSGSYGGTPPGTPFRISDIVERAKFLEDRGLDIIFMGDGYLQDKKIASSVFEQIKAVRKATNLMIMTPLMVMQTDMSREMLDGHEDGYSMGQASGLTLSQTVKMAKKLEGLADFLLLKAAGGLANHPNSFNMEKEKPATLIASQAIKESGAKIITVPNGGFRDPDLNEEYISNGKADMIAMARPFIAEPEYAIKAYEGRGEDMTPCIMCNRCHGTFVGPWISVCSVNPQLGLSSVVRVIDSPFSHKKVAVIGGGPAGMKAAITAAERGHQVTLYEKNDFLGGLLRHADFSPYKWALKDYKDFLSRQVYKAGVKVLLKTEATPEMIQKKGYNAVLAAVGAKPAIPRIPGADSNNVWNIDDVYGNEDKMGENIVLVGSGEFGVETGMYLANAGHTVTMLTGAKELLGINGPLTTAIMIDMYQRMDNFKYITEVNPAKISKGSVTYTDANGKRNSIQADSVILYAGLRPEKDEALKFYRTDDSANPIAFFAIGDCTGKAGNVQKSIRDAFFTASQI